jgi:hypothetical protein
VIGRRDFVTLLGGAAAWPLTARAQQPMLPVIGLLSTRSPAIDTPLIALIRQGLAGSGFVEGQNIAFDYRWAEGQYDRLAGLATDLVRRQVAAIITMGGELSALAAKAERSEGHRKLRPRRPSKLSRGPGSALKSARAAHADRWAPAGSQEVEHARLSILPRSKIQITSGVESWCL